MRKMLIVLTVLACVYGKAQTTQSKNSAANFIQTKGDSLYKAANLPGLFVGIFNGGKKFFNFGYAVPDEKLPFDSATVFEAGSITKTFTAYILESILQERKISDRSSIFPFLPDSVQSNKALGSISFLSLMNHTSGLPRMPLNINLNTTAPYDNYTLADLFAYLKFCTPKPDGKSNYSNLGMGLAGVLAQQISGKDYPTLLRIYLLRPFDMENVTSQQQQRAQGYFEEKKQAFWKMNALAPADGLQCSANDMLNYLQGISLGGNKLYEQAIIKKLLEPTVAINAQMNVCRAWNTLQQKGKPTIYWHNGGTYGFSTFTAFVKNTERCVIVVANRFNTNNVTDAFGFAILNKMLEE